MYHFENHVLSDIDTETKFSKTLKKSRNWNVPLCSVAQVFAESCCRDTCQVKLALGWDNLGDTRYLVSESTSYQCWWKYDESGDRSEEKIEAQLQIHIWQICFTRHIGVKLPHFQYQNEEKTCLANKELFFRFVKSAVVVSKTFFILVLEIGMNVTKTTLQ